MKKLNLIGKQFKYLTVIEIAPNIGKKTAWKCICHCGNTSVAITNDLTSGKHRSCGCYHIEKITKHGATKYGGFKTNEYRTWISMKSRCLNPNEPGYNLYGGRGITICKRWQKSFVDFLADMGKRPTCKHTIERINTNGNYEPSNCRWATRKEQAQNRNERRFYSIPKRDNETGRFIKN